MQLRDRVGRYAATGRHCQNWKKDQELVISLFNKIPISEGGAEGTLNPPVVVTGHASEPLYTSILYFQKKNFSGTPDGNIRPGGPTFRRLVELHSKASAAAPPRKGPWDAIATPSVNTALRKGLVDDFRLDHTEVVGIIRATLADGMVTQYEMDDLKIVAEKATTLLPRSKRLLTSFAEGVNRSVGGKGPYRIASEQHQLAAEMVCNFLVNAKTTYFPKLDREEVGVGLLMRIGNPGLIDQGAASLCGPAAMLFSFASDRPAHYVRFALDLYEKGKAKLGSLMVTPGKDVRDYKPPWSVAHVDWLTMASLRDSENFLLDYDTAGKELAGATLPGELVKWFHKAGYRDVKEDTNLTNMSHKGLGTVADTNDLFKKGYRVCLFISYYMTDQVKDPSDLKTWSDSDQSRRGSVITRHWVVQRSLIENTNGNISFRMFTWGDGEYKIPTGSRPLPLDHFLGNFYGYVAAKP